MSEVEDLGVTVEEYLQALEDGFDILQLKRLESLGIPHDLALEAVEISQKLRSGNASEEEVVRGIMILTPKLRHLLNATD